MPSPDPVSISSRFRQMMCARCEGLSSEALHRVPAGYSGSLAWHLGHAMVTTGLLVQGRCGLPHPLGDEAVATFRKGTTAADLKRTYTVAEFADWAERSLAAVAADRAAGRLDAFQAYQTSAGFGLTTVDEALAFLAAHDGIHLGYILALARAA